jgi:hypothetical protein
MEYDKYKVDEMVLALLYLTTTRDEYGARAWKGLPLEPLERLFDRGYIGDPNSKSISFSLTDKGEQFSKELFFKYFGVNE